MDFEICKDRRGGGGRRLTRERRYISSSCVRGTRSREACRIVGINLRTGKRWRNGHHSPTYGKPKPPITVEASASGLREEDRIHIANRLREKASVRQIARELGRNPSTISRGIRRNGMPLRGDASRWAYRPYAAHRRVEQRRPRPTRSGRTPSCGTSSSITSHGAGAGSRSARLCGPPFPTGRRCTWSTRRSTRPSRTSRSTGYLTSTSAGSTRPGGTGECSVTATAAPTCSSSPGRRFSGTSWSRVGLRTTRHWSRTGTSGVARDRLHRSTASPCACLRHSKVVARSAEVPVARRPPAAKSPGMGNVAGRHQEGDLQAVRRLPGR
ncbi:helix-turn-helix domain-containing protein [Streptomyces sp. PSKA54]|uniref:Helix-turn-helix domain-containing protein n=1 Tax=Streptomyces himalayensis subsp. aureolus TaxID=2758039 RepID=A0A7W2D8J3_9ACTN|nr:helix-turn-helix domain-containing protein [Streptomyces himalayensis subsp. aureolus]